MTTSTILSDNGATSGSAGLKTTGGNDGTLVIQTTTAGGTATTAMTLGTDQSVTFAQAANLPNTFGFKNRIINGAMMIDQRNAGASVTPSSSAYTLDRWKFITSPGSKFSFQQSSTVPTGSQNSVICTSLSAYSAAAGDVFRFTQFIEGYNVSDLGFGTASAATITISFWVRSSLTGTFSVSLINENADRSYVTTYTISAANTWEQKSVTIVGDTTGTWPKTTGTGLGLVFDLGSGSSSNTTANAWQAGNFSRTSGATSVVGTNGATFYITGVQLEKGSTTTSFDFRSYGTEFDLCRRYYEQINGFVASANSSSRIATNISYYPKRAAPTLGLTGVIQITSYGVGSSTQSSAVINSNGIYPDAAYIDMPNFSGLTTGGVWYNYITNSKAITLSSEL